MIFSTMLGGPESLGENNNWLQKYSVFVHTMFYTFNLSKIATAILKLKLAKGAKMFSASVV